MAASRDDLKTPKGELLIEMFPGEDTTAFNARLDGYITAGQARISGLNMTTAQADSAVIAFGHVRGYSDVLNRMLTSPTSVEVSDSMVVGFNTTQIRRIEERMNHWAGILDDIFSELDDSGSEALPNSRYVRATIKW